MDRQAIFNTAYLGLAGQGFQKSVLYGGNIGAYRGVRGLKCAIGHCIPDASYSLDFEREPVYKGKILRAMGLNPLGLSMDDKEFLFALQAAHDNADAKFPMRNRLHAFAKKRGLTIPDLLPEQEGK